VWKNCEAEEQRKASCPSQQHQLHCLDTECASDTRATLVTFPKCVTTTIYKHHDGTFHVRRPE